jgi:hypothetical protein
MQLLLFATLVSAGFLDYLLDTFGNLINEPTDSTILPPGFEEVIREQKELILDNTFKDDTILLVGNFMSYVSLHFSRYRYRYEDIHWIAYSGRWELEFPLDEPNRENAKVSGDVGLTLVESRCKVLL